MRRNSIVLLAVAVVAPMFATGCAHVSSRAECLAHQGSAWREVTSPHFRMQTNVDSNTARNTLLTLERWRKALLTAAWQASLDPPGRLQVVLLQSREQLREFEPVDGRPFFSMSEGAPLIVLSGQDHLFDASPALRVVNHELAHYLSSYAMLRQPRWVAEGFATYFEMARPDGEGHGVRIGEENRYFVAWTRMNGRVSWAELWSWTGDDGLTEEARMSRYATSWLWVHFLLNKYPEQFADFQVRLARAEEPRQAWNAAFDRIPHEDLTAEVGAYVRRTSYPAFRIPVPPVLVEVADRPMSDAEVHAMRARLWRASPGEGIPEAGERVKREIAEALSRDPHSVDALVWQIRTTESRDEALRLARQLVALHPDRPEGWKMVNVTLQGRGELAGERREAAIKAVELSPDDPIALNNLAWEHHLAKTPQTGLPLAQKAARLAPWSSMILDTWARLLADVGSCADAVLVQHRAVDMLREGASAEYRAPYEEGLARYQMSCRADERQRSAAPSESPP